MQRLMGASAPGETMKLGGQQPAETCVVSSKRGRVEGSRAEQSREGRGYPSLSIVSRRAPGRAAARVQCVCVGTWSRRRAGAIGLRRDRGQRWEGTLEGLRVAGCGQNKRKA
jgi:hypothetical protein